MNIINYSIESELLGSRKQNAVASREKSLTGLSKSSSDFHTLSNVDNFSRKLPDLLKEKEYDLAKSEINKIFCAQWLDEKRVLMGTKCNKLVTLDTDNGQYSIQSPLKSHKKSKNIENHCGIHSISMNPSKTMLATGSENVNDIAIYSLPDMKPVSVGYGAHSYWIFDTLWLDDQHVVSGSGDNRLALWKVEANSNSSSILNSNLNSSRGSSSSSSQLTSPSSSNDTKSYGMRRAHKRPLQSSSSLSSINSTQPFTFYPSLYNFRSSYSVLTQPASFNTNSTYFHHAGGVRTMRYRQGQPMNNRNLLRTRSEDNNNNNNNLVNFNGQVRSSDTQSDYDQNEMDFNDTDRMDSMIDNYIDYEEILFNARDQNDEEEEALSMSDPLEEFEWPLPIDGDIIETDSEELNSNETDSTDEDDDEDDTHSNFNISLKRRRLNCKGKYSKPVKDQIKYNRAVKIIKCKQSRRIRSIALNHKRNEIAAISMNSAIHYFDTYRFEQKYTKQLSPALKENVCLTINDDCSMYAIGSASHVQLLDPTNARQIVSPVYVKKDIGVRSVNFRNNLLSIGTGVGTVLFYDVRMMKFLENDTGMDLKLQAKSGWILRNESYYEDLPYIYNTDASHAIYSHSYDPSGTKLLTVGGPLTVNFFGHYAGIWR